MAIQTNSAQVHRLTDIRVEEVSMVDKAANKRKFLVVKRHEEKKAMPTGAEVIPGPNGTFTTAAPTPPPPVPAAAGTETTEKAACTMTAEMKAGLSDALATAIEYCTASKNLIDTATEVADPAQANLDPLAETMNACVDLLMDVMDAVDAYTTAPAAPAPGAPAPAAAPPAAPVAPAHKVESFEKVLELHRARGIVKRDERGPVLKRGAKMARNRLSTLEDAVEKLSKLVIELKALPPTGAPAPAPAGIVPGEDPKKKKPFVPGAPAPAPAPAPAAKDASAVAKLEVTVRAQASELAKLRKNVGSVESNAVPTNGGNVEQTNEGGADFSWPLDMNRNVRGQTTRDGWFGG